MKPRMLVLMSAIALFVALAGPIRLAGTENPVPLINQPLMPDAARPGGAAFTLTVNGTGFVSGAVVKWNGSARGTTFVSGFRLTASISASDIAMPGTASVTVVNPGPAGGTSNVIFFSVTPSTTSITMSAQNQGFSGFRIATGDLNGDGKLDLVVTGSNDADAVSVLLGNGDGTFQAPVNYPTGQYPNSVAVGDFNNDGKLDLAVANVGTNDVSVLLGNGDGTFQAAVQYGAGSAPSPVAVGDFNGDGNLDLAVGNVQSDNVSVLLGNGDGTFQAPVGYAVGSFPASVAVGDFNGDGKLDLVETNYADGNVGVLLGNGDGTFQTAVYYGVGQGPNSVAVGDFNGDGKLDLAVANVVDSTVSVLLGFGDGTFGAGVGYTAGSGPNSIAVGDFNGRRQAGPGDGE